MPTIENGNMFSFDLVELIKQKESLNLEIVQKRLILLAFIRANFSIKKAFKINCEGTYYTFDAYDKLWRKHFPGGLNNLKEQFKTQFDFEEDLDGKLIKVRFKKDEEN